MNKGCLIRAMADKANVTLKVADAAFEGLIEALTEALEAGEKVQISGFGTFELKVKGAREGINPKTGEKISIGETKIPAFKFGKAYKDSFNK